MQSKKLEPHRLLDLPLSREDTRGHQNHKAATVVHEATCRNAARGGVAQSSSLGSPLGGPMPLAALMQKSLRMRSARRRRAAVRRSYSRPICTAEHRTSVLRDEVRVGESWRWALLGTRIWGFELWGLVLKGGGAGAEFKSWGLRLG